MKQWMVLGYVMAANIQAVAGLITVHYLGPELDLRVPLSFEWSKILYPLGIFVVCYNYYKIIRLIYLREYKREKSDESNF